MNEDDNRKPMGEVTEMAILVVLHSFKKYKSLGPYGWPIEFFMGFMDLFVGVLLEVVEESRRAGFIHGFS